MEMIQREKGERGKRKREKGKESKKVQHVLAEANALIKSAEWAKAKHED